jgi:hypothetical protein
LNAAMKWAAPTILVAIGLLLIENAWVSVLLYHAWIALALSARLVPESRVDWRLGRLVHVRVVGAMMILMPAVILVTLPILDNAGMFLRLSAGISDLGLTRRTIVPFAIYICLFNGFLEEIYWRTKGPPEKQRSWIGDVLYALFHLPVVVLYMPIALAFVSLVALFIAGLVWRASLSVWCGKVWPAALSHVACNISIWFWLWNRQTGDGY